MSCLSCTFMAEMCRSYSAEHRKLFVTRTTNNWTTTTFFTLCKAKLMSHQRRRKIIPNDNTHNTILRSFLTSKQAIGGQFIYTNRDHSNVESILVTVLMITPKNGSTPSICYNYLSIQESFLAEIPIFWQVKSSISLCYHLST